MKRYYARQVSRKKYGLDAVMDAFAGLLIICAMAFAIVDSIYLAVNYIPRLLRDNKITSTYDETQEMLQNAPQHNVYVVRPRNNYLERNRDNTIGTGGSSNGIMGR